MVLVTLSNPFWPPFAVDSSLNKIKKENKLLWYGEISIIICREMEKMILNVMVATSLQPCTLEPTRWATNDNPSLMDKIFINVGAVGAGRPLDSLWFLAVFGTV